MLRLAHTPAPKRKRTKFYPPPPFSASHRDRSGGLVQVLFVAKHPVTLAEFAVYRDADGKTWVLPYDDFYGGPGRRARYTMLPEVRRAAIKAIREAYRKP